MKKKHKKTPLKNDAGDKSENLIASPSAKGLCLNCDDAEICNFPGFGDNVVYCEEHSSNFDNVKPDRLSNKSFTNPPDLGVKKLIPGWEE